jgi:3-deoxy-D-manno-octulosonic acid kinase
MAGAPGEGRLSGAGRGLLFDPALVPEPRPDLLDPATWTGRVSGQAGRGRGGVSFVAADSGEWALRHYRRGGLVGRMIDDRYLFTGADRTRGFREWRMLAALHARGLPVPRPVATSFRRQGLTYTADLATLRIPRAEPLSARLTARGPGEQPWAAVGRVIRRFHDAGAWHADLNAHNILLDDSDSLWLIDFDRGRFRAPGGWREASLARLERSLRKIAGEPGAPPFSPSGWAELQAGYSAG